MIEIPDIFLKDLNEHDIRMIIGVSLYEKDVMGTDECAEAIGIEHSIFIREMGKYGESVFDIPENEMRRDLENAKRFAKI
jgi:hypothetical protein